MKRNKMLSIIVLIGLFGLLIACNAGDKNSQDEKGQEDLDNFNESGFPIVDEEITLRMFTAKTSSNSNIDWNDLPVWNEYENMTNIKLDWVEQVVSDSLEEKRNLALGSGDVPDVFYASHLSNKDLLKYGEQGTFIKLNDLIDQYAPNLKKIMEENPDIEKGMTFPDGNIYAIPSLMDEDFLSIRLRSRPWFLKSWLEQLDMDTPETTEEFYTFLKAVQEADDEVTPYGGRNMSELVMWLRGSYGLNNTGIDYIDKDPDGEGLRFVATSDEYREMLEYIHKLYDEKLIDPSIFSIEQDQYMANGKEDIYASTVYYDPALTIDNDGFESGAALKGPHGDQLFSDVAAMLNINGQFVITDKNPDPEATVRWVDYFYSDDGAKLMYMGIEGESYTEENGKYQFVDEIDNADDRESKMSEYVPWIGINPPTLVKQEYFDGTATSEGSLEATEKIRPYVPEEVWSPFTYTKEENKILDGTGNDIEKYVDEMRDKFISGSESLDDDNWEDYLRKIDNMGLEEYMDVQEAAYDRYTSH